MSVQDEIPADIVKIIRDFAKAIEPLDQRSRDAVILSISSGAMLAHAECGNVDYAAKLVLAFMEALMAKSPALWVEVEKLMDDAVRKADPQLHADTRRAMHEARERVGLAAPKAKA